MRVISNKRLREFATRFPLAEAPLQQWRKLLEHSEPKNFAHLRLLFNSVDIVGPFCVFDIKGNDFRIVCHINFQARICYVRHVMTHDDYDRGKWK